MAEIKTQTKASRVRDDIYVSIVGGMATQGLLNPENIISAAAAQSMASKKDVAPHDRVKQLVTHAWGLTENFAKKWEDAQ